MVRFTLRQLEFRMETERSGSIASAARKLNVSAPAISSAEDKLEDVNGLCLLERLPSRGMVLTRDGEGFSDHGGFESAQTMLGLSLEAQAKLWPLTFELTTDPLPPALKAFIAGSVNDVLDAHLRRTLTLSTPVSDLSQAMVLATALTALFLLGNRAGTLGRKLTWRTFVFSGFLFVVMMTITDIQRGEEGLVRMDDTALRATILEMKLALGEQN